MNGMKVITCKGKAFAGFVSKHPGTEKMGTTVAVWSTTQAKLLPEMDVEQAVKDLKSLGHDELYLASVRTFKRL